MQTEEIKICALYDARTLTYQCCTFKTLTVSVFSIMNTFYFKKCIQLATSEGCNLQKLQFLLKICLMLCNPLSDMCKINIIINLKKQNNIILFQKEVQALKFDYRLAISMQFCNFLKKLCCLVWSKGEIMNIVYSLPMFLRIPVTKVCLHDKGTQDSLCRECAW